MAEVKEPSAEWFAGARWLCESDLRVEGVGFRSEREWHPILGGVPRSALTHSVSGREANIIAECVGVRSRDPICPDVRCFTRADLLSPVAKPEPGGELCEACGIIGEEREPLLTWAGDCEGALCCGDCLNRYRASEITDRIRSRREQQKQAERGAPDPLPETLPIGTRSVSLDGGIHYVAVTEARLENKISFGPMYFAHWSPRERTSETWIGADRIDWADYRAALEAAKQAERILTEPESVVAEIAAGLIRSQSADPYIAHPKRPTIGGLPATEADIALLTAEADAAAFEKLSASQRRERARRAVEPAKRETSSPHWAESWSSPTYESDH